MNKYLACSILTALVMLYLFTVAVIRFSGPDEDTNISVTANHILVYQGGISEANFETLQRVIDETPSITAITIDSGGGDPDAGMKIAELLNTKLPDVPLRVDAKRMCASACVEILSEASDRIEIDPGAVLLFHARIWRTGDARCDLCNLAHAIKVRRRPPMSKDDRHVMSRWAEKLSPHLNELITQCSVNPLDTFTGITLSGAEFNGLRDGSIAPKALVGACPENNLFFPHEEDKRLQAVIQQQHTA